MTITELQAKMPELTTELGYTIYTFLNKKHIPYKAPLFGEPTINDADAERAIQIYNAELEEKTGLDFATRERMAQEQERLAQEQERLAKEQERIEREENAKKKRATAQMLVTSGFNFDGYRIVKYSGYISGDDAMSVDRGYSWEKVSVRDELMASLTQIRRNALRELKEAAYELGCNAVIGVDFDYITLDPQTANFSGGTTYQPYVFCVTANGNAVIIEKIED